MGLTTPTPERTDTAMRDQTLTRYANQDGDRQVVMTVHAGLERPFALADVPAGGFGAPGTHFMLGAHATCEAAQEAAEAHATLCVEEGTYEAWYAHVAETETRR